MKKILGSLLLIFFHLQASQLQTHEINISTYKPYIKEGVKITTTIIQKDTTQTMFFEFTPKKSNDYDLILLKEGDIPLSNMKKKSYFEYILYPLHEGNITIEFDLIVKQATDEDMRSSFTIGQYKTSSLRTTDTKIDVDPITIEVKSTPQKVDLIGDYKLHFNIDKEEITSTQQVDISYHISGEGYPKVEMPKLLSKIKDVHYFEDIINNSTPTNLDISYNYAIISQKDFEIPPINIRCFDPKKERLYNLTTDTKNIKVQKIDIEKIVDKEDSYPENKFEWRDLIPYFNCILIFFAGFISKDIINRYKKPSSKPNNLEEAINKTKTTKELLQLLLSKTDPKLEKYINKLYKNRDISLSKIKKEILNENA